MKTKILTLICFTVVFAACKKNKDNPALVNEQKNYLIKKTRGESTETWSYDNQNKLTAIVFANPTNSSSPSNTYKIISYNNNGDVNEALYDYVSATINDVKVLYTYNTEGNLIRSTFIDNVTGATGNYQIIEYIGKQIKVSSYESNAIEGFNTYTKSADGKNVIEKKYYDSSGTLFYTWTYSNFDKKKNIQLLYPKSLTSGVSSENNYQTEIYKDTNSGGTTTFTYTFEYNADGYVTKRTAANGTFSSYEYIK